MMYLNINLLDCVCLSLTQTFQHIFSCLIKPNLDDGSVHLDLSVGTFVEPDSLDSPMYHTNSRKERTTSSTTLPIHYQYRLCSTAQA